MKKVFLAVIAVIVVLAGGLMLSYNGLAGSKEAVETAEADVDTMMQIMKTTADAISKALDRNITDSNAIANAVERPFVTPSATD